MTEINREGLELLPCPFCGRAPTSKWRSAGLGQDSDGGYWGIDCCHAFAHEDNEEEAAAAWNRRAYLPFHSADAGLVEARLEHDNGRRWRIVGQTPAGEWHMQPIGHVTAEEARVICERSLAALRSQAPAGGDGEKPVAWQHRIRLKGAAWSDWFMGRAQPVADGYECEERPLYASPPAPAAVGEGWQPIKTAPKDGSSILLYEDATEGLGQFTGYWAGGGWLPLTASGMWTTTPTHWMPLPARPTSEGEA